MNRSFQVAGYDKETERLSINLPLPQDLASMACELARVDANDDGEGAYPLDPSAAVSLGGRMQHPLNTDAYDWFLEPAQND